MTTSIKNQIKQLTEKSYQLRDEVIRSATKDQAELESLGVDVTNLSYEYEKIIKNLLSRKTS